MSPNLVIVQLLHTSSSHDEFLRLYWPKLTPTQKKDIFHFLYRAKQNKTFLSLLRFELNNGGQYVPWTHTFAILNDIKKINTDNIQPLLELSQTPEEYGLFRVSIPQLNSLWDARKQRVQAAYLEKKEELLNTLQFAQQQGLKSQRLKVLKQLKGLFPKDKKVLAALHSEREFAARQTLTKISSKRDSKRVWDSLPKTEVDPELVTKLYQQSLKAINANPNLSMDVALALSQMELYEESLKIFDTINNKTSIILWYELRISIEGKQFARALSLIDQIKIKERLSTDHAFSLLYYQAVSMYGLGQSAEARHLLRQIVKIRPHFKSATSLLIEWESEQ